MNINEFIIYLKDNGIFSQKSTQEDKIIPFTLFCVCYRSPNSQAVHFVSCMFNAQDSTLHHYDSGVEVYPQGQKILTPSVTDAFVNAELITKENSIEVGNTCRNNKKIMGIQYDGKYRDALCQSWSLYILNSIITNGHSSIYEICHQRPQNREYYLYDKFIIPILENDEKQITSILKSASMQRYFDGDYLANLRQKSPREILDLLRELSVQCT